MHVLTWFLDVKKWMIFMHQEFDFVISGIFVLSKFQLFDMKMKY